MKRLFFALWPDDATRKRCGRMVHSVRDFGRPVALSNIHVTLVFLGNVDEAQQAAMQQAAAKIECEPLVLNFKRLAYWKKPAVLCLTAECKDSPVLDLVSQLTEIAIQNAIAVDQRPYRAHVTLLRKAKSLPEMQFELIAWQAREFCLVESRAMPYGVEYRVLERWPCGRPGDAC